MDRTAHYPGNIHPAPARRRRHRVGAAMLAAIAGMALLAGCGGGKQTRTPSPGKGPKAWAIVPPDDPATANAVLMRAISLVGTPYRYGGNTPEGGFDCSGLVNYVYRDTLELRLPRTASQLASYQGPKIKPSRLTAGDLVFFGSRGRVTHVGIYVGEGRFVHAPSTGGTVRLDHLDGNYWRDHYSGARRVLQ